MTISPRKARRSLRGARTTPRRNVAGQESGITLFLSDRGILGAPIPDPTFDEVLAVTRLCEQHGHDDAETEMLLSMLGLG